MVKFISCLSLLAASTVMPAGLSWTELPPLPDAKGFAGAFAGVAGGSLIVAGGTNFPNKKPWEGGTKHWYDTLWRLPEAGGPWIKAGRLPRANGYGVSITTTGGLILIGGGNADVHCREVLHLTLPADGAVRIQTLPELPRACAFMTGVLLENTLYVAGGIDTPAATKALHTFWALDLKNPGTGWQELDPWPGPERILATMGACDGAVYLFSGARLKPDADGKATREWLKDAFRFMPGKGWQKLADLPRVAVAAPSPAPLVEGKTLLVLGGDDGALVDFEPKDKHPGFPRDVLAYDTAAGTWSRRGEVPFSLVTTAAVIWNGRIIIPGGEARPGKRSPAVWRGSFK